MKRYQRIQVCIDSPERDGHMLEYVRAIAPLAESKEIFLVHVTDATTGDSPDEPPAALEVTADSLAALAGEHFKDLQAHECHCEVMEGSPLLDTLRFAYEKDVDLIVIGRHCGETSEVKGEALLARRITRKATCTVLVLPEDCRARANTILVPVRNSECSANALDVATAIAKAANSKTIAFNIYGVPSGYSRVGTTLEEHQALLEAAAERECAKLLKRVDTHSATVECRSTPDHHGEPVPIILGTIADVSADLVVIGARGRTGAAGVLLGTITEQLIRESPVPVLAVKKKGECLGVLRALLTLASEG